MNKRFEELSEELTKIAQDEQIPLTLIYVKGEGPDAEVAVTQGGGPEDHLQMLVAAMSGLKDNLDLVAGLVVFSTLSRVTADMCGDLVQNSMVEAKARAGQLLGKIMGSGKGETSH